MTDKKASGWILIDPQGQILLVRNATRAEWGVPKGHLETGETLAQAAARELEEETGLTLKHIQPRVGWQKALSYAVGSHQKTTTLFAADCPASLSVTLSDEHDDWCWASPEKLRDLIVHKDLLDSLQEALGVSA